MKKLILSTAVLCLAGCAAPPNSYIPQLSATMPGKVNITPFKVQPVIVGTAGFADWERLYYSDSVIKEFENIGAYDPASPCTLTGSIDRVSTVETGGPLLHAELDVSYTLLSGDGVQKYNRHVSSQRELPGIEDMVGFVTILNHMSADTIKQVVMDNSFSTAIKGCR